MQLNKNLMVWLNPNNGFSMAALKDLAHGIKLPNSLSTYYEGNLALFNSICMDLDYELN